jgi:predicted permease
MRRLFLRLFNVVRRARPEQELAREIAAHLALIEDDYRRQGLTPDEAHRAARLAFGGVEQTKERQRDTRSFVWLDDLRRDIIHAARLLRRNPVFTLTAALSLAIGIGANTAIFTVANAILFREPVGVVEPERLVDIGRARGDAGFNPASFATFLDIRARATTLAGVYAQGMFPQAMSLGATSTAAANGAAANGTAGAERVFVQLVTTSYFTVLGATPSAGRLFDSNDSDALGASPIVVLSHGFWTRRFNADPSVIGRPLRLNGQTVTIVGVAAPGFQGNGIVAGDIWAPLTSLASDPNARLADRSNGSVVIGGRLKPGVSVERAAAELAAIGQTLAAEHPDRPQYARALRLLPSSRVPGNRSAVALLLSLSMAMVSMVLIVACANVAGVLLARAAARRREMAVRLAIGAGRARLVRQLLTETTMVFAIGGAAGLVLAWTMRSVLIPLLPSLPFPISVTLALDGRVLAFTVVVSFVAAILSGLTPALQASKADVVTALKDDSHGASLRSRLRSAFVIAQIAFSLLLVVLGGLFVRALQRAGSVDPGFNPRGVELATIDLAMAGYTEITGPRFAHDLLARVRGIPAVESAALARVMPGGFEGIGLGGIAASGSTSDLAAQDGSRFSYPSWNIVEPGYFATLAIPLVAGRDFNDADTTAAPSVAIVSEALARRLWPGRSAVGQSLAQQISGPDVPPDATRDLLVVGIVRDVRSSSLIDGLAEPFVYVPLQQHYTRDMTSMLTIAARATHGQRLATELRALVTSMDPNLAIVSSQTLEESTALGFVTQRVAASISGSLGSVGLLLAAIGIYGVTAYSVTRRTREIGIRLALGAPRREIVGMVLGHGLSLAATGAAIGLTLAALASSALAGFLFGLPPLDPPAFLGAAALLATMSLAACYVPVRRATRVDPVVALRHD